MNQIDNEITSLRKRLVDLEERKCIEIQKEKEMKSDPMPIIEAMLDNMKQVGPGYNNNFQQARYLTALEDIRKLQPIVNMLRNIQQRLETLEKK